MVAGCKYIWDNNRIHSGLDLKENMDIIQVLAAIFKENLGNRITPALANGIMFAVNEELKKIPPVPPKADE